MISSDQLDLKETVETTLENAKGWLLATYPSQKDPADKIQIMVNYPKNNVQEKPESIRIFRGNTYITLGKNSAYTSENKKQTSYGLTIHVISGQTFSLCETPLWGRNEGGEQSLFKALQQDTELNQYISFVPKNQKIQSQKPKWSLNRIMQNSRV